MRHALALLSLSFVSGCASKDNCAPPKSTEPDYARPATWACRPDVAGDACDRPLDAVEVRADGSTEVIPFVPDPAPKVDCFYVYPTVDLGLRTRLHDDLSDRKDEDRAAFVQAARFGEVCRVFAPLYRQVTIGTYASDPEVRDFCLDQAYSDVERAFDHYMAHDNGGRPFVLISHSQGSHHVAHLIRRRIDDNPALREKLVAALAIGGNLGTDKGGLTGGSFRNVPVCTSAEQQGCVVGYRSYPAGVTTFERDLAMREGEQSVCVHPGDVPNGGPKKLSGVYLPSDMRLFATYPEGVAEKAPFVLYRDFFEARCVTYGSLKVLEVTARPGKGDVRTSPLNLQSRLYQGNLGLHLFDVPLGMGDLIALVRSKVAAR